MSAANETATKETLLQQGAGIVFFDGVCGLCNRFVDFVVSRDREGAFRFAPLQGKTARLFLTPTDVHDLRTVVVADRQGLHRRSDAVIVVLRGLGGLWGKLGRTLSWIPRPIRDFGYGLVARSRYVVFGKKQTCRMPSPSERSRFFD